MQISSANRQTPISLISQKPTAPPLAQGGDKDGDADGAPSAPTPSQVKGSLIDQYA